MKKKYYGQITCSLSKRWASHKTEARRGANTPLHRSIAKHGAENFWIEEVDGANSQSELNYKEWLWIVKTNSHIKGIGYNLRQGGANGKMNESTKDKLSKIRREIFKNPFNVYDKETRVLIGRWENQIKCSIDLKLSKSAICNCLRGVVLAHSGYVFCFIGNLHSLDETFSKIIIEKYFNVYRVECGTLVGTWNNRNSCAKELGVKREHIFRCLKDTRRSSKGFKFVFIDNK